MSKRAISYLKQAATGLPDNTTPTRQAGTGTKKRTTDGTHAVWPRDVILNPSITTANVKMKLHMLLQGIYIRTIHHRPQNNPNLASRCADKKPLLTSPMMKMMTGQRRAHVSQEASRVIIYDSKSTVNTVKYPESVMVWGAFSGNNGRWGLFFFPKIIENA